MTVSPLLVATLARDDAARHAFDAWQKSVDLDALPPGQYELLPLLHQNLTRLGTTHAWLGRLRGVARKSWYSHQLNLEAGLALCRACEAAGCGPLALACDAATAHADDGAGARRPLNMLPLLVQAAQAPDVLRLAHAHDWRVEPPSARTDQKAFFDWRSSVILHGPAGHRVRLKWTSLDDRPDANLDAAVWTRLRPAAFRLGAQPVLDDTAALLLACATTSSTPASLPALADAGLILMGADDIDWPWLVATARAAHVAAQVRAALTKLADALAVAVPAHVLVALAGPAAPPAATALTRHIQRFRRIAAARRLPANMPGFIAYLQHTWGLASAGDVPARIVRRLVRR